MNPQVKDTLDLFKEVASKTTSGSAKGKRRLKLKSLTVKKDGLVSVLRNKKEATVFMSQLNTIIKSRKKS
ncbi:hypothetical protein [Daejeonella sp.]|uniref:hypothetical protein n=1 Tax=Daejeonella sp. TaxID=2805397 RepID=UPI0030C22DA8